MIRLIGPGPPPAAPLRGPATGRPRARRRPSDRRDAGCAAGRPGALRGTEVGRLHFDRLGGEFVDARQQCTALRFLGVELRIQHITRLLQRLAIDLGLAVQCRPLRLLQGERQGQAHLGQPLPGEQRRCSGRRRTGCGSSGRAFPATRPTSCHRRRRRPCCSTPPCPRRPGPGAELGGLLAQRRVAGTARCGPVAPWCAAPRGCASCSRVANAAGSSCSRRMSSAASTRALALVMSCSAERRRLARRNRCSASARRQSLRLAPERSPGAGSGAAGRPAGRPAGGGARPVLRRWAAGRGAR